MRACIVLVALVALGCSQKSPELTAEKLAELPTFRSIGVNQDLEIAKPIDYDLSGIWDVSRFGTKKHPQKGERWEVKWNLRKANGNRHNVWFDRDCKSDGCDVFRLLTVPVGKGSGQVLVWQRLDGTVWNFSINEQQFGFLQMTGDDGDGYMAVRTEGPPAKLTCRISDWSMTEDGDLFQATLLTSDNTTHKAIWFEVGKKLLFPQWFTHGEEAQKLRGDKLQEAWEARTPGVYKMEPPPPAFTNDLKSFGKEAKFD